MAQSSATEPEVTLSTIANTHQPNVSSCMKAETLYLTIHLKPSVDFKACGKTLAQLQQLVDSVVPPDKRACCNEIWAGVGFGPDLLAKLGGKSGERFALFDRKCALGAMPATGGDLFIHAKSDDHSKLFELAQRIVQALPKDTIESFEDIYGWEYQGGRDMSLYIDGTENPKGEQDRSRHAVEPHTGGSYCLTQKWHHDHSMLLAIPEAWIGREMFCSAELQRKTEESHVARMVGSVDFKCEKKYEIVRQSMSYGTLSGESGLFFLAFSKTPASFDYMLDRMVGSAEDSICDDVMRFSECLTGQYFYFPSVEQLEEIVRRC